MSKIRNYFIFLTKLIITDIELRSKLIYIYITNQTPVIIYQMGKVGSSSVARSLRKSGIIPVFHAHSLSKGLVEREVFDQRQLPNVKYARIRAARKGRFLYDNFIATRKSVKIISLTREPISRNIAGFFQNFEKETGKKYDESNFTPQELTDIFLEFFPHSTPLKWFDNNIKAHLGIDVYEYPFPKEEGILSIHKDNVDLLLLKSEIPDDIKEKSIADFLGIKGFKLINTNVGENKNYSNLYKAFKQNLKLPMSYLEEMCNSKYFNHFYTDEEVKKVMAKWTVVDQ